MFCNISFRNYTEQLWKRKTYLKKYFSITPTRIKVKLTENKDYTMPHVMRSISAVFDH